MAVPCARVCQPLLSPGYGAVLQQTPDGKGGRNKSGLLGRRRPLGRPSTAAHKRVLLKVRELFPSLESRPPGPRWESSCWRRDARLLALHLTRRPQSRAARLLPALSPLPAASTSPSLGREVGEREGGDRERGLGGSADSRAPGKCLNNRTDATALVSFGCRKVDCCCDWSCSLGLPGAERSRTKSRPAPLEPAAGPRTLPLLLSTPAVPGKLRSSRLRWGATTLPSLAAAAAAAAAFF